MIDFSDYRRLRRLGFSRSKAWQRAARNSSRLGDSVVFGLSVFFLLFVMASCVDQYADNRQAETRDGLQADIDRLEKIVIQCLSRSAVAVNGRAFVCEMADLKIDL